MVRLEPALQPAQNLHGLLYAGLDDVDLLEATRQSVVFLEDTAVFGVRRRTDALQLTRRQRGLQQIGCIERAARRRTGTDQRMDLVDEENSVRIVQQLLQHGFQPLLEIAAVFGTCQQSAHIERVHLAAGQNIGHVGFDDPARQPFGDRGLADPGFTDQQRIVLAPAAQRLHHALQLTLASDQRVDLAGDRQRIEVHRVGFERATLGLLLLALGFALLLLRRSGLRHLADAVRDVVHDVQARDALLVQEIHRVGVFLTEDSDQHVGARHLLLAGGLHVQDGALDHALKAQRRLGVDLVARDDRRVLVDEIGEQLAQLLDVRRARTQHLGGRRIVQQR